MKVAVVTSFPADPARPHGGVEAVSVNLVRALAALNDLEVHVVSATPGLAGPESSSWRGACIHRIARGPGSTLGNALRAGRRNVLAFLRELRPDVVHAHDTYGLMVRGLDVPRVFTIHGFIHGDTRVSGTRLAWLRSRIWRVFETTGWADQPHIVSISPYVRERLTGIARGVIHDIDNPVAPEFFEVKRAEKPGTVFSAALVCRRKNPLALVEAAARVIRRGVDLQLRLAGAASEEDYARQLRRRIVELGVQDCVTMLGGLGELEIRAELAAASVFALVSLEEGSPMGIEESMAAGVPVLTSNRCGMPYMVRDGESGFLVDPMDVDDIAWRLEQLLRDEALRARMSEQGQRIARERFHPDVVALRTREVYRRAMRDAHRTNGRG